MKSFSLAAMPLSFAACWWGAAVAPASDLAPASRAEAFRQAAPPRGYPSDHRFYYTLPPATGASAAPEVAPPPATAAATIDLPVSPGALPEVRSLLEFMHDISTVNILSGQQEFPEWEGVHNDYEIDFIQANTGKLPAVRGFDFMFYTHSAAGRQGQRVAERAIAWAQAGGIVTICVHWFMDVGSPAGQPAFYTPEASTTQSTTTFDIRQALVAGTPENQEFTTELDMLAGELKKLRDARVPVIWRPFHECSGNWFWWSRWGAAPYIAAWRFMFERFTQVHGLNNLIWCYNPVSSATLAAWYPGDAYVDMIGLDIYPAGGHSTYATDYAAYRDFRSGRKVVALTENGAIPDPAQLAQGGVGWAYFCTWDRSFIINSAVNPVAFVQGVYNHPFVLTRDELPDVYRWASDPPIVSHDPSSAAVTAGAAVQLSVAADGGGQLSYQWFHDGAAIAGAVASSFSVAAAQPGDAGIYSVAVTNSAGTTSSRSAAVTVGPLNGRLTNLSTRGPVLTGNDIMIAGFVIGGSAPRTVLIRGIGPGLVPALNASEVLSDPQITVFSGGTPILSNNDWWNQPDVAALESVTTAIGAGALAAGTRDAALVGTFAPGPYTVHVAGTNQTTGVALTELHAVGDAVAGSPFVGISTRGFVGPGNAIMIPGIIVGQAGRRLVLRGIGPGLGGSNLTTFLPDPKLRVLDLRGNEIATNDDWGSLATSSELAAATAAIHLNNLADGSRDAALVIALPAGIYTVHVSDTAGRSGIALVEAYEVPES